MGTKARRAESRQCVPEVGQDGTLGMRSSTICVDFFAGKGFRYLLWGEPGLVLNLVFSFAWMGTKARRAELRQCVPEVGQDGTLGMRSSTICVDFLPVRAFATCCGVNLAVF